MRSDGFYSIVEWLAMTTATTQQANRSACAIAPYCAVGLHNRSLLCGGSICHAAGISRDSSFLDSTLFVVAFVVGML